MNIEEKLSQLRAERAVLRRRKTAVSSTIEESKKAVEIYTVCSDLISTAASMTQHGVKEILEDSISSAMQTVYDDKDVTFELDLSVKSKRLHAKPWVVEGENKYEPEDERGGGLLELLSFAMRVVLWSIKDQNKSRPVFILDEPLKFVGRGRMLEKAATILHSLHEGLGIQIIVITHEDEIAEIAHKAYKVTQRNGVAKIEDFSYAKTA